MPWTRTSHTGMCLRIPGRPWQTAGSALVDLERRRCCWSSDHTYSSESLPHHGSHVGQRGEGPAACLLSQETYPREEASRERGMLKHPALLPYPFYFRSSRLASKSDGVCTRGWLSIPNPVNSSSTPFSTLFSLLYHFP